MKKYLFLDQFRTLRIGRTRRYPIHIGALLAACLFLCQQAAALPIPWRTQRFQYAADGKPLKDVLRDFAATQAMTAAIAPDLSGSVAGKFDVSPQQFLDLLAMSYGFVWYYNGSVLQISSAKEMKSTVIKLSTAHVGQLRDVLTRMRIAEPRFPIRYDEQENTALVSGPQEYVDVVREMAGHLERRKEQQDLAETRVIPLFNAWAADHDQQPGVASMLQSLYRGPASGPMAKSGASGLRMSRTLSIGGSDGNPRPEDVSAPLGKNGKEPQSLKGWIESRRASPGGAAAVNTFEPAQSAGPSAETVPTASRDDGLPVIVADATNNSIIVRDLPERMAAHEDLIRSLDKRPRLVEIEVHIIEIQDDALEQLGVDWNLQSAHLSAQSGGGTRASASYDGKLSTAISTGGATATPVGGVLTAVIGNSGQYLLTRVAALAHEGRARISSRPKVATLNNVEAVMDNQQTFYIRVAGYQSAQLYNVSAGVSLRVRPMAIASVGGYRVKLGVHVEDGEITTQTVENIPIVSKSQIDTQAFVGHGESLLLAGYAVERKTEKVTGVPWLSELPMVGGLFRQTSTEGKRVERMFLLTPRVID